MLKEANIGQEIPLLTYHKSAVCSEKKGKLMNCNDDFEKVYASALTEEELKQRLHQRIDAWEWNENMIQFFLIRHITNNHVAAQYFG